MAFVFVAVGAIIALAIFAYTRYAAFSPGRREAAPRRERKGAEARPPARTGGGTACPLCGTALGPGVNLVSRVFGTLSENPDEEQRCTIQGCPHCYGDGVGEGRRRSCPVCGKDVPPQGWLVARMWMQRSGRRHVRIIGCTECHKKS